MGVSVSKDRETREKFLNDMICKWLDSEQYSEKEYISVSVFTEDFIVYLKQIESTNKIPQRYLLVGGSIYTPSLQLHIGEYFLNKKMLENMCIKIPIDPSRGKFLSDWTKNIVSQFLDSEYCEIVEGKFISLSLFTLTFLVYAQNRLDISIPRELLNPSHLENQLHLYFHEVERENVYIDGIINNKILVGVSVLKWTALPHK